MVNEDDNTPADKPSQAPVNVACEKNATNGKSDAMTKEERGGERLDRVLKAHGYNRSKLASAAGLSSSAVQKWYTALQKGDMNDEMWRSCASALQRIEIDPEEVRPGATVPTRTRAADLMMPILQITDRDVLRLLIDVLSLESSDDREVVINLVMGRIKQLG